MRVSKVNGLVEIPIEMLMPKIYVRRDVGDLRELIESIKNEGVLQPLIVAETENEYYEIICGYRRYIAAKEAGSSKVPAVVIGKVNIAEALELIWKENELRKEFTVDERCLIITALVKEYGVRETSRRLGLPLSTVETLSRAGRVFSSIWSSVQTSNTIQDLKFKPKVKLAEEVYKAVSATGRRGREFSELAGRVYLLISELPIDIAQTVLSKWVNQPSIENLEKLVSEAKSGELDRIPKIKIMQISERVPIEVIKDVIFEKLLIEAGYSRNVSYRVVSEAALKIVDLEERYNGVSGLICPRCNNIIRCRVCGSIAVDLCGFPHAFVRDRKYRYVKQVTYG